MKAYADTMTSKGHEVYVVTPMYDAGYRGQYPFEIVDYVSVQPTNKIPWRVGLDMLDPHFKARINQIDFDICHVHSPLLTGNLGVNLARKLGIPVVGSFHTKFYDDVLQVTGSKAIASIGASLVAEFYESCDEVWAVSEGSAETLRSYGYKGEIVVMPNGTYKRTLNIAKIPSIKEKHKIKSDVPIILYVGQISWKKNLKRIIESCSLLKRDGFDFQLVMAGRGPDEDSVRELLETTNITDKTVLTGHLTDIEELDVLYSLADLFLFPSVYDTFSLVLREAASQYTPGLVVEGTCAAEDIKHMDNGLLAKDDSQDIFEVMKQFFQLSEEKRRAMGQKAYDTLPILWNGPLMDKILDRYEELVANLSMKNRTQLL
ncbi:MAG: glycosyltransferase [Sphaerochaetaceae bacterium]|nr:glycosyltransferase [Sphaerochaetaceae bacterium]